jgi:hypothetical protein
VLQEARASRLQLGRGDAGQSLHSARTVDQGAAPTMA